MKKLSREILNCECFVSLTMMIVLASFGFVARGEVDAGCVAVDLGLPSGTKWASCNVGATCPEQIGDYYAWGEIATKSEYSEANSITGKMDSLLTISENPNYDVARVVCGGNWRLPTHGECEELLKKCIWTWTTLNGRKGMMVTSKKNKKSIFLPASGGVVGGDVDAVDLNGGYWCGDCDGEGGYALLFNSWMKQYDSMYRFIGYTVRAVQ